MRRKFYDISESFDFDNQDSCLDDDFVERYNKEKVFEKFRNFWNNDLRPYMLRKNIVMIPIGNWLISLPIGNGRRITIEERRGKNRYEVITGGVIQDYKISKEDEDLEDSYEYFLTSDRKQSFVKALAEILDHKDFDRVNEGFDFDSEQPEDYIQAQVESYNPDRFKMLLRELATSIQEFYKVSHYMRSVIWHKNDKLVQVARSSDASFFRIMGDNSRIFVKILPNDVVISNTPMPSERCSPITLDTVKKWSSRVKEIKNLIDSGIERSKKGGFQKSIENVLATVYNLAKTNPEKLKKHGKLTTYLDSDKRIKKFWWEPSNDDVLGIETLRMDNPEDFRIIGKIGKVDNEFQFGSEEYYVNPIDFDYFYNNIMTALK